MQYCDRCGAEFEERWNGARCSTMPPVGGCDVEVHVVPDGSPAHRSARRLCIDCTTELWKWFARAMPSKEGNMTEQERLLWLINELAFLGERIAKWVDTKMRADHHCGWCEDPHTDKAECPVLALRSLIEELVPTAKHGAPLPPAESLRLRADLLEVKAAADRVRHERPTSPPDG